ncbi:MAG: type II toxin-antitoxin system PemK/MazF family toxin [bacterium]|nr:type II toxin-antitoxin system PemK/MazF family toxin [bacterium]
MFKIKINSFDREGHVISGEHFCIVVSPDPLNKIVQTAMVVFITSRERPGWSWRVPFKLDQGNPDIISYAITEQVMTLDRKALKKSYGSVRSSDIKLILTNLVEMFQPHRHN